MNNFDFKSCALIYNPKATKFKEKTLMQAHDIIKEINPYMDIKLCQSQNPGHLPYLVKENNERDLIITLGGDGTVKESFEAFNEIEQNAVYTHLSVGTTNDMATNLNLSDKKPLESLKLLLTNGTVKDIDILKMNDKPFAYISAFGYLAHVPFVTPRTLKKTIGHAGYVLSAIPYLPELKNYNITVETDKTKYDTKCFLGMISNYERNSGVKLHPYADPTDGLFEVTLVKKITPSAFMQILGEYFTGKVNLKKYEKLGIVDVIQTDNLKLTFNDLPKHDIDNDGEQALANLSKENNTLIYKTDKKAKILLPNIKR